MQKVERLVALGHLSDFDDLKSGAEAAAAYAEEPSVPENLPRLIHDTGRTAEEPPEDDLLRLTAHGEYQARVQAMRSFLLTPTITRRIAQPTIVGVELERGLGDDLDEADIWALVNEVYAIRHGH